MGKKILINMNCVDFLLILTPALPCLMLILLFYILQNIDDNKHRRKKIMIRIFFKKEKYRQVDTVNPTAIKPKQNGKKKSKREKKRDQLTT